MQLFHICGGTLGVLSGTVAIFLRKASPGMPSLERYLPYPCWAWAQAARTWH
jgi:hypothetical protein